MAGRSRPKEWGPGCSETVQTGDVLEELLIGVGGRGGAIAHAVSFKGGHAALQKLLHAAYKRGDTSVEVRVRHLAHMARRDIAGPGHLLFQVVSGNPVCLAWWSIKARKADMVVKHKICSDLASDLLCGRFGELMRTSVEMRMVLSVDAPSMTGLRVLLLPRE